MANFLVQPFEIEAQVLDFMNSLGIFPADRELSIDGTLHRFRTAEDSSGERSGAYCIYPDHLPAGYVQDWRKGIKSDWVFKTDRLSQEQREHFNSPEVRAEADKLRLERKKKREQDAIEASELARVQFESMKTANDGHPYLQIKKVRSYGLHLSDENTLAIPLRDIKGDIKSLQWIFPDGTKRFFKGAPFTGIFWAIALDTLKDNPNSPILIGEGYATMAKIYELTSLPCVAAMNCYALKTIAEIIKKHFKRKIIIMADDDAKTKIDTGKNPGLDSAYDACNFLKLQGVFSPPFKSTDDGTDWDDFALKYGDDATSKILKDKISWLCLSEKQKSLSSKVEKINAAELLKKEFEPIRWAVDGFLPEGLSLLAGSPKVGKSILSLHLSIAVALGGYALGKIKVEQGSVLYLALEDTQKRLQERLLNSDVFQENSDLSKLDLVTRVPRQHEGGLEFIQWWIDEHLDARLIIIDTLQKFRRQLSGRGDRYSEDYDVISEIKTVADKNNVPILVIHHLKKVRDQDDWLNEISGSMGLAGSADTIFSLKRARVQNGAILHRTGRDVEEKDFAITLDRFGWTLEGDVDDFTLPDWKKDIIKHIKENGETSPMKLSEALKMNLNTAQQYLRRLEKEGLIKKTGYGIYDIN